MSKEEEEKEELGLWTRPKHIECMFVERLGPCLRTMALHVKLLHPFHGVDTMFSSY